MAFESADIAHVIQVAVAPVFLLSGIGAMLGVFVARLGRIIDRSRTLDERLVNASKDRSLQIHRELAMLSRRSRLMDRASILATAAGCFVCLVIVALFVDYLFGFDQSVPVARLFLLSMLCFMGAFGYFLREVLLATARLRREGGK